jgi:hypothetical protein
MVIVFGFARVVPFSTGYRVPTIKVSFSPNFNNCVTHTKHSRHAPVILYGN